MWIACLNPQGNFDPGDFGLTAHPDFGGQLVYVKELALALSRLGHRVDILTRRIVDPDWPPFAEPFDGYPGYLGVRIIRLPCGPPEFLPKEQLWPHLKEWVENIIAFYRKEGQAPAVFTAHYGDGGMAGVLLKQRLERPLTFTAHSLGAQKLDRLIAQGMLVKHLIEHYQMHRRIVAERAAMAHADRIIVSTHLERKEQYGHPLYRPAVDPDEEAKFALVRPGINLDIFDANRVGPEDAAIGEKIEAAIRRDIAPRRWHLPCVIASSRLEAKKNHLGLLRAWAVDERLRHAANLLLVVRGCDQPLIEWRKKLTGTEREVFGRLMQEILTHHLSGMVCAFELGTQQALAAAYRYLAAQKQGVFALTAFYEPFGLAPLEALAAGLPAVVTRNGGPAETLRNDQGQPIVLLVDPENPKDIASALVQLTTCSEVWEKFRRLGREHVLSHYSWEATARGYLAVCEQILAGRTAARTDYPIPAFFENPTEPEAQIPVDWISHYVQAAASKSHGPGGKTERGA